MREPLLTRLRRHRGLIGQVLAVFMLLQPVALVIGADIAAQDPLTQAVLASFCSPSGGAGPASGGAAVPSCCLPSGTCAAGPCCAAVPPLASLAAARDVVRERHPDDGVAAARYARSFHWPQPTGPPVA
ncbi:MAG: hypothetical protein AB7O39_06180 [Flavobacteriaceae bacterium]